LSTSKALHATAGDVFMIPISDSSAHLGQVIAERGVRLYMIVFDRVVHIDALSGNRSWQLDAEPLFAIQTFDGRFDEGAWRVIGHAEPDRERFLPAFTHGLVETGRGHSVAGIGTAPDSRASWNSLRLERWQNHPRYL
jgi:hypothetical protein